MTNASRKVLVVEDESGQRAMYERALRLMDFEPDCVSTPAEAKRRLAQTAYPVVLLDLHLAGESGMDLFELIRRDFPSTSVVVATGYGNLDLARQSIRLEAVDFLCKPVPLDELEGALTRAWARSALGPRQVPGRPEPAENPFDDDEDVGLESGSRDDLRIDKVERDLIMEALRRCGDSRREAAKLLGISERKLYYRLMQYRAN